MRKFPLITIIIISILLISVSILYGYLFGVKNINQKPKQNDNIVDNKNINDRLKSNNFDLADDFELSKIEDNYVGPNTKIIYTIKYLECNHSLEVTEYPKVEMINMSEEQFRDYINEAYPNSEITFFSHSLITIRIQKSQLCPNHFIIGEKDGKIAIYNIGDNGEKILNKILENAPVSLLKEIDQERLKNGIIVDSLDEVYDILENFIS